MNTLMPRQPRGVRKNLLANRTFKRFLRRLLRFPTLLDFRQNGGRFAPRRLQTRRSGLVWIRECLRLLLRHVDPLDALRQTGVVLGLHEIIFYGGLAEAGGRRRQLVDFLRRLGQRGVGADGGEALEVRQAGVRSPVDAHVGGGCARKGCGVSGICWDGFVVGWSPCSGSSWDGSLRTTFPSFV